MKRNQNFRSSVEEHSRVSNVIDTFSQIFTIAFPSVSILSNYLSLPTKKGILKAKKNLFILLKNDLNQVEKFNHLINILGYLNHKNIQIYFSFESFKKVIKAPNIQDKNIILLFLMFNNNPQLIFNYFGIYKEFNLETDIKIITLYYLLGFKLDLLNVGKEIFETITQEFLNKRDNVEPEKQECINNFNNYLVSKLANKELDHKLFKFLYIVALSKEMSLIDGEISKAKNLSNKFKLFEAQLPYYENQLKNLCTELKIPQNSNKKELAKFFTNPNSLPLNTNFYSYFRISNLIRNLETTRKNIEITKNDQNFSNVALILSLLKFSTVTSDITKIYELKFIKFINNRINDIIFKTKDYSFKHCFNFKVRISNILSIMATDQETQDYPTIVIFQNERLKTILTNYLSYNHKIVFNGEIGFVEGLQRMCYTIIYNTTKSVIEK
ncbi:MAG: hypothetical protein J0H68_03680 [Sphingobacteriia bacterium]|nr:hypothetical protein [Sphingobacteriia bacterium]